ncbi:MAG: hypothetical protein ACRENL_04450, partial [Candidatus Dormibacteria bacterium]
GLGHLERMLALADALRPGIAAAVVVPEHDDAVRRRVVGRGHVALEVAGETAVRARSAALESTPDVIVLDGYVFDVPAQERLRDQAPLIVVDDLGLPAACHLAVNPAPGGEGRRPAGADAFLGGATYALIPPAVVQAREAVPRRGRGRRRVLVSTGATDPSGLCGRVVATLLAGDATVEVVAVVGPDMRRHDLLDDARLNVLLQPATLAGALAAATLFAGAAGTSAVQAACVGIPAVVTATATNQEDQAAALAAAGCALAVAPDDIATHCLRLLEEPVRCAQMSQRGRVLVDGRGAARVADSLRRLIAARAA